MSGGNAIRGFRIGAGPLGETERGDSAPRQKVAFWCAVGHVTRLSFATDAELPDSWDCQRCGIPAGRNEQRPPDAPKVEPYKTHLAYVKERRTEAEGVEILNEALARLKARREEV
jgi:hypothetical protein